MSEDRTGLQFEVINSGDTVTLENFSSFVAGYTGRDPKIVQEHIDELAAIGVAPPPQVPMFYPVNPATVTTAPLIKVSDGQSSGEVEPLYVRHQGRYYLGVASDHTDRQLETEDIGRSKRACPTPVGRQLLDVGTIEDLDLDSAAVSCQVDGQLYQDGHLAGLLTPREVVQKLLAAHDPEGADFICLGGTLPLRTSSFIYGTDWTLQLEHNGHTITHQYSVSKENES
jgi:hypothetical protein